MAASRSSKQLTTLFQSLRVGSSSSSSAASASTSRRCLSTSQAKPQPAASSPKSAPNAQPKQRSATYPFSSAALIPDVPAFVSTKKGITPPPAPKTIFDAVMPRVHADLRARYDPGNRLTKLFDRKSPERIPPGSVLIVESWTSPLKTNFSSFSGVLIAVRRRGVSTSFVLRNLVQKLGVEMRFNLYSPLLKDVRVIQKADAGKNDKSGKLRRTRRAKLYYLRKDDRRLAGIGNVIKQQRLQEEKKAQEMAKRRGSRR
ncbi:related to 50S ribosomal protein L19 [Sporisorium reilianum SRZ2]|uniref:Related to 50S ribosomal protein L19 n=1 Tax=Sporisorium reilianum (strain SRZ2) TaxID=999809 RepID=E6ZWH1_SPORE|nr:related to 50S ribosomal protein L19 [Sporisorium reilianum SRZ2]